LVFSDVPTEAEIAEVEKAYNLKKDLEGIDPSLIISDSRKRGASAEEKVAPAAKSPKLPPAVKTEPGLANAAAGGGGDSKSSGSAPAPSSTTATAAAAPLPPRPKIQYTDEEAEF
jgi:hypothetical protein